MFIDLLLKKKKKSGFFTCCAPMSNGVRLDNLLYAIKKRQYEREETKPRLLSLMRVGCCETLKSKLKESSMNSYMPEKLTDPLWRLIKRFISEVTFELFHPLKEVKIFATNHDDNRAAKALFKICDGSLFNRRIMNAMNSGTNSQKKMAEELKTFRKLYENVCEVSRRCKRYSGNARKVDATSRSMIKTVIEALDSLHIAENNERNLKKLIHSIEIKKSDEIGIFCFMDRGNNQRGALIPGKLEGIRRLNDKDMRNIRKYSERNNRGIPKYQISNTRLFRSKYGGVTGDMNKVLVKRLNVQSSKLPETSVSDIHLHGYLAIRLNCIPRLHGYGRDHNLGGWVIVMEDFGREMDSVEVQSRSLREKLSLSINICNALHELHLLEIHHCNLTPKSVLVDRDDVKFIDFFQSKEVNSVIDTVFGAKFKKDIYKAPEYSEEEEKQYNRKGLVSMDIYSAGVIILELISGKSLKDEKRAVSKILKQSKAEAEETKAIVTTKIYSVLEGMTRTESKNRDRLRDVIAKLRKLQKECIEERAVSAHNESKKYLELERDDLGVNKNSRSIDEAFKSSEKVDGYEEVYRISIKGNEHTLMRFSDNVKCKEQEAFYSTLNLPSHMKDYVVKFFGRWKSPILGNVLLLQTIPEDRLSTLIYESESKRERFRLRIAHSIGQIFIGLNDNSMHFTEPPRLDDFLLSGKLYDLRKIQSAKTPMSKGVQSQSKKALFQHYGRLLWEIFMAEEADQYSNEELSKIMSSRGLEMHALRNRKRVKSELENFCLNCLGGRVSDVEEMEKGMEILRDTKALLSVKPRATRQFQSESSSSFTF
eukprot:CAMPEP_0167742274 /NCGR_PEP_ID=MMETSP0110_2-20121227/1332_1 /TAXON_ID=629695 /ORGANISM="Gymnochlora sp., Strain CCMP2014" /LENGTH=820 /DNA_ID=CAMNT_0007626441 /DNA_START=197 /DNA_END=2659 /DNA_ORIENTATION=+